MKLTVISHKPCWPSASSSTGYATDGGFPMQMQAISQLFDETVVVVPCAEAGSRVGEMPIVGRNLSITPVSLPGGMGLWRKLGISWWLLRNGPVLLREILRADAIHAPIPGDIGTVGILLALMFRKPLFVRHCGNWLVQTTLAERFWKWLMERFAGGRNVMLATGGATQPPSARNSQVRWIFSTSLSRRELEDCPVGRRLTLHDARRLIIVCRQEHRKGTGRVIQSLPLLLDEFPALKLDIVGDGSRLTDFRRLAESLGMSDRVVFHGRVTHAQVLALLWRADLFCYPTTAPEGFPKVVLEALACGLPVVTTRVSVLPHLIGAKCGVLIDLPVATAIARAIRSCLADGEFYHRLSENAVVTARQYSIEAWRDTIGALLEAVWGPLRANGRPG